MPGIPISPPHRLAITLRSRKLQACSIICRLRFTAVQNRIVRMNSSATSANCASVPTTSVEEIQNRSLQTPFRTTSLDISLLNLATRTTFYFGIPPPRGRSHANRFSPSEALCSTPARICFLQRQKLLIHDSALVNKNLTEV